VLCSNFVYHLVGFAVSAFLIIEGYGTYAYEYILLENTINDRTIQGLSTKTKSKMYECVTCPYDDYRKFVNYYGKVRTKWVNAKRRKIPPLTRLTSATTHLCSLTMPTTGLSKHSKANRRPIASTGIKNLVYSALRVKRVRYYLLL
jgi:hypothetical protein